jgi:hypothetical protein
VPAKKTRKSADGARYLLSADRKFRRLSLKKISERVKSAGRRTRARASAKSATPSQPPVEGIGSSAPTNAPVAFVLIGAVVFAVFVGVLWSSPSPVNATENTAVLTADVASAPAVPAKSLTESPAAVVPRAVNAPPASAAVTPKVTSRPADTATVRTEIAPRPSPTRPASAPVDAHREVAVASSDTVTITGCLDYDGKSAWLKETSGDVPRSRSWRSGFLKKRSPRIALVDGPTNASAYDGRRVSVTGVLIDREMRVNSVHPIEGECAP